VKDPTRLAAQIDSAFGEFTQQNFAMRAGPAMESAAVGVLTGVPKEMERDFAQAMRNVMRVIQIPVADDGGAVHTDVAVKLGARQESGRPVTLKVTLADGRTGNMLHVVQMNSMLVDPITPEQWKVLAEAAVFKVAENLRRLLNGRPVRPRDTLTLTESGPLKLERSLPVPAGASKAR